MLSQFVNRVRSLKIYKAVVITFEYQKPSSVPIKPEITIERVNPNNLNDALIYEPKHKVAKFKNMYDLGEWGYYAYLNNKWVHRSWVAFGPKNQYKWINFGAFNLLTDEVYIHYCETAPEARGQNIYPAVLGRIGNDLVGQKRILISTTEDNVSSQRGIIKAGFVEIERVKITGFYRFCATQILHKGIDR